ncbi:unnamed protein product [Brassica rapa]|uniref:FHA domain-containing protein n=1 Tax=Brassica campestris TaxID=3711 RepID=A0A3P6AHD4_BRACM|nr:unnamed protein product [Brassica rapa]VDC86853.1 unnamed protein product [Brassica rapa]
MEAEDDHPRNKDLFFDVHHQSLSSTEAAYSPNAKTKVESGFGLFCVMRKRARGDDDDDMSSSDFDYAEKGDDFFCSDSDSDTDLSECSEFDVISHHVVEDKGLFGFESLSTCNSPCLSEDHKIGLGISSLPLTKTLEGPGRQWSVCGSVTAVRNIPLVGGACSSLGEQLDVNVSSFEGMDAEADGEDEMSFSDIDAMVRRLNLIPDDSDSCLDMEERNMSKHPRHALLELEHCSVTSVPRGIISQGALAVLHCRDFKHFIRKHEVIIGRSSDCMNVDIDLGKYGYGSKISRRQALVKLENNGSFSLKNLGKRHIIVNGEKLSTGQIASLASCSSVDIRGEVFVFKINKEAVRQFLKNNAPRNSKDDTKFRWCE